MFVGVHVTYGMMWWKSNKI